MFNLGLLCKYIAYLRSSVKLKKLVKTVSSQPKALIRWIFNATAKVSRDSQRLGFVDTNDCCIMVTTTVFFFFFIFFFVFIYTYVQFSCTTDEYLNVSIKPSRRLKHKKLSFNITPRSSKVNTLSGLSF